MPVAPFSSLTLRGRARRLKVLAQRALTQYDLDVRASTLERVRSEAAFLEAPRAETNIECPLYSITKRGDYVELQAAFREGCLAVGPWVEQSPGEVDMLRARRGSPGN